MTVRPRPRFVLPLVGLLGCVPGVLEAQDGWKWPDEPENLQILPSSFDGDRLRAVMTGFTRALGVDCSHCHVGEPGASLDTYDFPSDDNPRKNVARTMLNMLGVVNDSLSTFEPSGTKRVNMWCHTCHRGRPRPMTVREELDEAYGKAGTRAALEHYQDLRDRFYGRGAYDFGEAGLNGFGYRVLGEGKPEEAVWVFELNAGLFPESGNVFDSLAEAHMQNGDRARAIELYEKSLELAPDNRNAVDMLHRLRSP